MKREIIKNKRSGYMLIEIIVSLGIFSVVAVLSTTALLSIVDANSKAQAVKSVIDNLAVAVENMSRVMRVGSSYSCSADGVTPGSLGAGCTHGSTLINFTSQEGANVTYRLNGSSIQRIYRLSGNTETTNLTAPEVTVNSLKFYIFGSNPDNTTADGQPRVLMVISGTATSSANAVSNFTIQTTVTQRQPDNATNAQANINNGSVVGAPAITVGSTPNPPDALIFTNMCGTSINLYWSETDNSVVGYNVYRNGAKRTSVNGGMNTSYTDDVTTGTPYSYSVTAVSAGGGESSPTNAETYPVTFYDCPQ